MRYGMKATLLLILSAMLAPLTPPDPAQIMRQPAIVLPGQHQAFFCRKEWEWEQKTGLPIKFRLGSVEYVDFLEGKD